MSDGVLHIRDVQGPKKEGSETAKLPAVEQETFKCQGMVERGVSANHSMITDFIRENKLGTKSMGVLYKLQERIDRLQGQIYELQLQNYKNNTRVDVLRMQRFNDWIANIGIRDLDQVGCDSRGPTIN
ncbi:40S ribosomal protein S5-1 [Hordeum vulgare]|nr:40S ribosomal protein S5-1 [Hordeum vulgare]